MLIANGGNNLIFFGNTPGEMGSAMVRIEDLVNLNAQFRVVRKIQRIPGEPFIDTEDFVTTRFTPWALKVWAFLYTTTTITWEQLVDGCTSTIVDEFGQPVDEAGRIHHLREIDAALANLIGLGLISPDRVSQDGLEKGVEDGLTAKALREVAARHTERERDQALERARLEYRLQQLRGDDPAGKKNTRKTGKTEPVGA
jgi:hypothetical protein